MDTIALADRIVNATCHLVVVNEKKKVLSAGSGVLIEGGKLLTAGHVLFQRVGHAYPGNLMIRGHAGVIPLRLEGFVAFPEINVGLPELIRPVRLDIVLANLSETPAGMQPLPLAKEIAPRGTEVFLAGFTDEIPLAVDLDWSLEVMNPDMNTAREFLDDLGKHFVRAPMPRRTSLTTTLRTVGAAGQS